MELGVDISNCDFVLNSASYFKASYLISFIIQYLLPLILTAIFIFLFLNLLQKTTNESLIELNEKGILQTKDKKRILTLLMNILIFFGLFRLPSYFLSLFNIFNESKNYLCGTSTINLIFYLLAKFSCLFTSLIYCWPNRKIFCGEAIELIQKVRCNNLF